MPCRRIAVPPAPGVLLRHLVNWGFMQMHWNVVARATEPAASSRPERVRFRKDTVATVIASILSATAFPGAALAQEATGSASDGALLIDEVIVTGSRIQRVDYVSPNPVLSVGAGDMERLGIVNVSEAIQQVPFNVSSFQPATNGGGAFFVGSTLANLRGLNPFFGTRTLTLVNSRRFVPSNQGGSVDLGMIPSALISRMEVVTGGASAAYGSDAVSGVVNVILDPKLEGLKIDTDYGASTHGDGRNYHIGFGTGTALFGGRGHITFGGEYQKNESIDDCAAARDWCRRSVGLFSNGGTGFEAAGDPYTDPVIPGQPQQIILSDLRVNQSNYHGVIFNGAAGATTAVSADASGSGTMPFAIGQYGTRSPTQTAIGGDGALLTEGNTLYPEVERKTAYTHFTFEVNDSLNVYAEGSFGQVGGWTNQEVAAASQYCIKPDNAFLTGAFGAAALAAGGNGAASNQCLTPFFTPSTTDIVVRKDWRLQRDGYVETDTKTYRGVLGFNGKLAGTETWTWDAYYQYGRTERSQILNDNLSSKRMTMAVDSIIDDRVGAATFGQPICRVTRDGAGIYTAPIPGDPTYEAYRALGESCVPLNLFGLQASPEALRYVFGNLTEFNTIKQNVFAASTSGELWQGWGAGALSAAAGVEYRTEKLTNDVGDQPFFQRTDFANQFGDAFAGKTTVKEVFVELEMPLLRDAPGANRLVLNAAARHTWYDTEDELNSENPDSRVDVDTWKLALVWDPLDWLRIRGSHSRDMRAAGFRELYYSQTIPADPPGTLFGFGGNNNPWLPAGAFGPQYDPATIYLTGNTALKPEKATTSTIGFVLSPKGWAQGMQLAVDYYEIELLDSIRGGVIAQTITNCYQGDESYCALVEGIPGGTPGPNSSTSFSDIISLRAPYQNGNPYNASGVDFSASFTVPFSDVFRFGSGNLSFYLSGTRSLESIVQRLNYPDYVAINLAGQSGGNGFLADFSSSPKWSGNFSVSYLNGPFALTTQLRYSGKGMLNLEIPYTDPSSPSYDPNLVGSITDNTVPSATYVNLTSSYNFRFTGLQRTEVFLTVNNLFDREPPFANGSVGGTNAVFFDTMGRTYRAGVRLQF
jgi:iron complex outermembrane receptor protein